MSHRCAALAALLVVLAAAAPAERIEPGLQYQMFGGPDLTRPGESGLVPDLGALDQGHQDWALRFSGLLTAPASGEYLFRVEADTGVRLRLDGQLVIDGWAKQGARTGTARLTAGQAAACLLEYYFDRPHGGRHAVLRLFWTPPGGREQPVPAAAWSHQTPPPALLEVRGDEQGHVNLLLPDGGLKPVVGVQNIQVFRAGRGQPELTDGDGYTYAHHQDLAVWQGRLYAAWAMTPRDEDVPPYKVVYATSTDGCRWSVPAELFPREGAWACRFYFYRASNGRMLAFCAGKTSDGNVSGAAKSALLVREIAADHRLGEVFTLVAPAAGLPPSFERATEPGFVAACREAAGNNLLLEQQDFGRFLGDRRMAWHTDPPKFNGWVFGKALCFYHRQDGAVVGLCKWGFATLSQDDGKTWSKPVQPPSLIAGSAKVWGQRTPDGRYALAYTPDRAKRFPLVLAHGDDGRVFRDLRFIHGELPRLRYQGKNKDLGAQYMRGLAEWADDGTFAEAKRALWLVYSVNKEDIWVARVPLPVKPDETAFPADDIEQGAPGWNRYSPRWAPVSVTAGGALELRDADPYDYARAVRAFPETPKLRAELQLEPAQANARLELELCDAGGRRPVRLALTETGQLQAADGGRLREVGRYAAGETLRLVLVADLTAGSYTVQVNNGPEQHLATAETGCRTLQRLSLRTGVWRGLGDGGPVAAATDVPAAQPAVFRLVRCLLRRR